MTPEEIYRLERPHPSLLWLYIGRAVMTGPLVVIVLPILLFRYYSLRYRFDDRGIHMQWGVVYRREINLTYARIQDIHLRSGVLQRWLGLADLMVQTASGAVGPEMTIEGFREHHALRDFLYTRMRGLRGGREPGTESMVGAEVNLGAGAASGEVLSVLSDIRDELRAATEALRGEPRR